MQREANRYFDNLITLTHDAIDVEKMAKTAAEPKEFKTLALPSKTPPIWLSLVFGAVSATSGAVVAYPLTLIRTKLMTEGMPGV